MQVAVFAGASLLWPFRASGDVCAREPPKVFLSRSSDSGLPPLVASSAEPTAETNAAVASSTRWARYRRSMWARQKTKNPNYAACHVSNVRSIIGYDLVLLSRLAPM